MYGSMPRPRPHCVRWGPSSPPKGRPQPTFLPMCIVAKRIKMPHGQEAGLGPGDILYVLDGDPAHPQGGGTAAPTFRLMSTVGKRSPISATTAELLFTFSVSRRRRKMYIGHARLRLSVCLSVPRRIPTPLHGPGCNLGE